MLGLSRQKREGREGGCLTVSERVEAQVVSRAVSVNPEQTEFGRHGILVRNEHRRADCPADIDRQDGKDARQVHGPAPEPHHHQRGTNTADQTPALVAQVVLGLEAGVRVADQLEHVSQEVRDDDIAGKLREKTEQRSDEHAATHTGGPDHIGPRLLGVL